MIKIVIKSKTHGRNIVLINNCDYDIVSKYRWIIYRDKSRRTMYAVSTVKQKGSKTTIKMHRLIMEAKNGQEIDHVNRNGLDNRRRNLRFAKSGENQRNVSLRKDNHTGYKGVDLFSPFNKFRVRINFNGKSIFLGYYDNLEKAALAYNVAAKKYHKDYAFLNKI